MTLNISLTKEEIEAFKDLLDSIDNYNWDDLHVQTFNKVYDAVNKLVKEQEPKFENLDQAIFRTYYHY
jgi:hypothetical protein